MLPTQHTSSQYSTDLREVTRKLLMSDLPQFYAKVVSTLYFRHSGSRK